MRWPTNRLPPKRLREHPHLNAFLQDDVKVAVRSRRELVARVFTEHYWPRFQERTRPAADGSFAAVPPLHERLEKQPSAASRKS